MRKFLLPIAAIVALTATPALSQGSGSSGDIGGANTMSSGQQTSGGASPSSGMKGDAMAPKKMKAKKKSSKM